MKLRERLIISTMAIGIFLCMLDTTVMNIALPAMQTGLHISLESLSWTLNVYTITFAVFTIPLGRLADIVGRSRMYLIGLIVFLTGSVVSGLANGALILITGRALQSLGAAIVFPASMTIGIATADMTHRTMTVATLGITQGLAAALGPTLGGIVTQFLGWRWIFFINAPLILLSLILCLWLLPIRHEERITAKIDYLGMLFSMVTLFSLTLALVKGNDWGWDSLVIVSLLASSLLALILFIVVERRVTQPMVPLVLFRKRQFTGAVLAVVITGIFLVALIVIMPTFLTKIQGKTELMAALMVTPISAMIFIFSPISGLIINKIGPRLVVTTGFALMVLGYIVIAAMDPNQYWQMMIAFLLVGAGYGIIAGPIVVLSAADFTGELLSASQSVLGLFRQIGTVLAVAIFVSTLTVNLNTARKAAINNVDQYVETLNLPTTVRSDIKGQAVRQIKFESKNSSNQSPGISNQKRKQLINQTYQRTIANAGGDMLPATTRQAIYEQVRYHVNQNVAADNKMIQRSSKHIKNETRKQFTNAFISPYRWAIPFLAIASCSSLLFYKRREYAKILRRI